MHESHPWEGPSKAPEEAADPVGHIVQPVVVDVSNTVRVHPLNHSRSDVDQRILASIRFENAKTKMDHGLYDRIAS